MLKKLLVACLFGLSAAGGLATPGAVELARAVRGALTGAGVTSARFEGGPLG